MLDIKLQETQQEKNILINENRRLKEKINEKNRMRVAQ